MATETKATRVGKAYADQLERQAAGVAQDARGLEKDVWWFSEDGCTVGFKQNADEFAATYGVTIRLYDVNGFPAAVFLPDV